MQRAKNRLSLAQRVIPQEAISFRYFISAEEVKRFFRFFFFLLFQVKRLKQGLIASYQINNLDEVM